MRCPISVSAPRARSATADSPSEICSMARAVTRPMTSSWWRERSSSRSETPDARPPTSSTSASRRSRDSRPRCSVTANSSCIARRWSSTSARVSSTRAVDRELPAATSSRAERDDVSACSTSSRSAPPISSASRRVLDTILSSFCAAFCSSRSNARSNEARVSSSIVSTTSSRRSRRSDFGVFFCLSPCFLPTGTSTRPGRDRSARHVPAGPGSASASIRAELTVFPAPRMLLRPAPAEANPGASSGPRSSQFRRAPLDCPQVARRR